MDESFGVVWFKCVLHRIEKHVLFSRMMWNCENHVVAFKLYLYPSEDKSNNQITYENNQVIKIQLSNLYELFEHVLILIDVN